MLHNSKPQLLSQALFRIWRLASAAFGQCNIFMLQGRLYSFLAAEETRSLPLPPHSTYLHTCYVSLCVTILLDLSIYLCVLKSYILYLYLNLYLYVPYLSVFISLNYVYLFKFLYIYICIDLNLCVSICVHRYLLHLCIYLYLSKL